MHVRPFLIMVGLAVSACAADPTQRLIDLEGPRRAMAPPGPWRVAVTATEGRPRLWAAIDDAAFAERPLSWVQGVWVGALPAAPDGAVLRYYATLGGEQLPATGPRVVPIRSPRAPDAGNTADACTLQFLTPGGDVVLGPEADEAPQAGLQITVAVATEGLMDGDTVRLSWGPRGTTGRVVDGQAAFEGVTLAEGVQRLVADAQAPGGLPCQAALRVVVRTPP